MCVCVCVCVGGFLVDLDPSGPSPVPTPDTLQGMLSAHMSNIDWRVTSYQTYADERRRAFEERLAAERQITGAGGVKRRRVDTDTQAKQQQQQQAEEPASAWRPSRCVIS